MIFRFIFLLLISVPSLALNFSDAERLYRELKTEANIPYDFPDGCHAKAHAAVRFFEDRGVVAEKLFIEGHLFYRNSWEPSFWTFHVVPVLMVEDQAEPIIFDLFLFDRPVVLSELIAVLNNDPRTKIKEMYKTSRYIYSPMERYQQINSYEEYYLRDMEIVFAQIRRRIEGRNAD